MYYKTELCRLYLQETNLTQTISQTKRLKERNYLRNEIQRTEKEIQRLEEEIKSSGFNK